MSARSDDDERARDCRCDETTRLVGVEAKEYADRHLVVHWRRDSGEWFQTQFGSGRRSGSEMDSWLGTGFGETQCPSTGWRFSESWQHDPESHVLERRPWTQPSDYLDPVTVRRWADDVRRTHQLVHETVARRGEGEEQRRAWLEATAEARLAQDGLYSPDLDELADRMKRHDSEAIDAAIVFLEVDPWVFRSGYRKDTLLKRLSRARLDQRQKERVGALLVAALVRGPRTEFPAMVRLAHHVRSPRFADELRPLTVSGPAGRRRAAARMLATVEGSRRSGRESSRRRRRG